MLGSMEQSEQYGMCSLVCWLASEEYFLKARLCCYPNMWHHFNGHESHVICTQIHDCLTHVPSSFSSFLRRLQDKPHKCSLCAKSFPTPGDLRSHMYVHSGSWPFKCHICSRGFSKQTNLKNHLFLHTGKLHQQTKPTSELIKKFINCKHITLHQLWRPFNEHHQ